MSLVYSPTVRLSQHMLMTSHGQSPRLVQRELSSIVGDKNLWNAKPCEDRFELPYAGP